MLSIRRHFKDFTHTSALPLLRACATEEILCCTSQALSFFLVIAAENLGTPLVVSTSAVPNVSKVSFRVLMRPVDPSFVIFTTGQLLYLSTIIRYVAPL